MHEPAAHAGPLQGCKKSIIQYNFQYTELFRILNTLWSQSGRYTEVLLYMKNCSYFISSWILASITVSYGRVFQTLHYLKTCLRS